MITNQAQTWISQTLIAANSALAGYGGSSPGGSYKGVTLALGSDGGSASGGGLYFDGASLSLTDSSIVQNQAIGGTGGNGVLEDSGSFTATTPPPVPLIQFVGNGGSGSGGGLALDGGQSELVSDTVSGNSASGGPGGSGTYTYGVWYDHQYLQEYITVPVFGSAGGEQVAAFPARPPWTMRSSHSTPRAPAADAGQRHRRLGLRRVQPDRHRRFRRPGQWHQRQSGRRRQPGPRPAGVLRRTDPDDRPAAWQPSHRRRQQRPGRRSQYWPTPDHRSARRRVPADCQRHGRHRRLELLPAASDAVSVEWGSQSAALQTAADGLRLLPQGRTTDLPWLGIDSLQVTLSQARH